MAQIMRDAQPVDFGTPQTVGVAQDTTSYRQPNYTKYEGTAGRIKTASNLEVSGLSQLLGAIAPAASKWGNDKIATYQQEAYLAGQAAAASGKSAEAVQSNILTKDWATAGWSDTRGRLALAEANAQTAVDMTKLREQSPEEMQTYLNTRREGLMPLMEGMSMEARKAMMGQMLLSDQHAVAKHLGEHQKFIVDQQAKAITTSFSVANDAMNAAKGDEFAYDTAANNAVANIWGNVVANKNLPTDLKHKMVTQAASLALTTNNEALYEKMRDAKDSNGVSLIDQLPFESQVTLAKAYQASRKDTDTMRNSNFNTQLGLYEAKLGNPLAEPVSWEDHQAMMQQGEQIGVINGTKRTALTKQWAEGEMKKQRNTNAASMYAAGDINGLYSLGMTEEEGAAAWSAVQQRKGITPGDAVASLAQIGLTTGQASAFSTVGKLMRSAITTIGSGATIDPGQLSGVNTVLSVLDQAQAKGNLSARTAFLSSFDDATQARLLTYWDGIKQGKDSSVAAADAATAATENATLTAPQRAALAQHQAKENTDIVAGITAKGLFARMWESSIPDAFRSNTNVNTDKLRAGRALFEDESRADAAMAKGKVALLQELTAVSNTHPYLSADSRKAKALANVAARTLTTDGGPLVLPQGQTVQSFFGVPQSVSPDLVASTLNTLHTPAKGNRTVYQVTAAGQLQWQEYGQHGELVSGGGTVDPRSLVPAIQAEQDKFTERFHQTDGAGIIRKTGDAQVQFNGNNTIGIGTRSAFQIRDDLVKMEGVRAKPYDDASGKVVNGKRVQTVGVGVSTTNDFYPPVEANGEVSQVNINRSFMQASDAAMKKANTAAVKLPAAVQQNPSTMRLFTQLAYQGGSVPQEVLDAVRSGDAGAAMKALMATTQYKMAHAERRVFYTDLMQGIMPLTNR